MKIKFKLFSFILIITVVFSLNFMVSSMEFNQAPMLEKQVKEGQIPELEKRLPDDPIVIPLTDEEWGEGEIGKYGGTLKKCNLVTEPTPLAGLHDIDPLASPDIYWPNPKSYEGEFSPSLWTDWEYSEDLTEFTAEIRKGVKWSDGKELTADDYIFGWKYVHTDPEVTADIYKTGGEVPKIEKIDDYTIKWTFATSNPLWELERVEDSSTLAAPKHYLSEYHPEINEDSSYEDFEEMNAYGEDEVGGEINKELPQLGGFIVEEINEGDDITLVRNPYYYLVDPEGNQLPYIDRINLERVGDEEVAFLNLISGKYDYQRHLFRAEEGSDQLIVANMEEGDYHTISEKPNTRMMRMLFLNWDTPDEDLREYFRNFKFRKALSLSIKRDEINEIMYDGRAITKNHYFANLSPYYEGEDLEQKYTEYKPEEAEKLLDEVGLEDTTGDGWRNYPDGEEFHLIINATSAAARVDHAQMVVEDWQEIGLNATVNTQDSTSFFNTIEAGEHDIVCDWPGTGTFFPERDFSTFAPYPGMRNYYHTPKLTDWFESDGEKGREPEEDSPYAEARELVEKARIEPDREKRNDYLKELGRLQVEELLNIGLTSVPQPLGIEIMVSNDIANEIEEHIHDMAPKRASDILYFSNPERREEE